MSRLQRVFLGMIVLCVTASASSRNAGASTAIPLLNRTFVSAQRGSDGNPCTPINPCRTFTAAIAAASAGGEVIVLDSGGYGPFTVTKAIQISSPPGVYAGLITIASDGITINAAATDVVVIRGLTLNGLNSDGSNSSYNGISVKSVGSLFVENCVITGGVSGIYFGPAYDASQEGFLTVKDSAIRKTNHSGILLSSTGAGHAVVTIDHVRLEADFRGVISFGIARVTIRDSIVTGNKSVGIVNFAVGVDGEIAVENCAVLNNYSGVASSSTSQTLVSNTLINGNGTGVSGTTISYGNNRLLGGNTVDGNFSGTELLQ